VSKRKVCKTPFNIAKIVEVFNPIKEHQGQLEEVFDDTLVITVPVYMARKLVIQNCHMKRVLATDILLEKVTILGREVHISFVTLGEPERLLGQELLNKVLERHSLVVVVWKTRKAFLYYFSCTGVK
jgi:hypothetical protein